MAAGLGTRGCGAGRSEMLRHALRRPMFRRQGVRCFGAKASVVELEMPGGLTTPSAEGGGSSATLRHRYYMHLKITTDPFLQDYFFKKFIREWAGDSNSYGMMFIVPWQRA